MLRLIQTELFKIWRRPRSYIGFVAIGIITIIIEGALKLDGETYLSFITQQVDQSFELQGKILNGNLAAFVILQSLIIQMPLLIALVTGDMVSGETASGTLRLILTRPVSRLNLVMSKFIAGSIYAFALIAWLGILSIGMGYLLFGTDDLIVLNSDHIAIISKHGILIKFVLAMGIAFVSLSVVSALSIMISCFADNSIVPIVAGMTIIFLFTIIGTMEIPLFDYVRPWLFTTHMISWRGLFADPVQYDAIFRSLGIMVLHIVVFLSIGMYHFKNKDILS